MSAISATASSTSGAGPSWPTGSAYCSKRASPPERVTMVAGGSERTSSKMVRSPTCQPIIAWAPSPARSRPRPASTASARALVETAATPSPRHQNSCR
jgi:hypothetical protein